MYPSLCDDNLVFVCSAEHVSHLENVSEDEINRLLGMVVDVENLFMSVHKEEDTDTKQVYFYLFKVNLRITFRTRYTEHTKQESKAHIHHTVSAPHMHILLLITVTIICS